MCLLNTFVAFDRIFFRVREYFSCFSRCLGAVSLPQNLECFLFLTFLSSIRKFEDFRAWGRTKNSCIRRSSYSSSCCSIGMRTLGELIARKGNRQSLGRVWFQIEGVRPIWLRWSIESTSFPRRNCIKTHAIKYSNVWIYFEYLF